MALRTQLARSTSATLNDNITAFGYSILITGSYGLLSSLQQPRDALEIFAGAAGAVLAFITVELINLAFFRNMVDSEPKRGGLVTAVMRLISVGGGMGAALLCASDLQGIAAWFTTGFAASFVFLLLDGVELVAAES
jgi:hypothetical protein